REDRPAGDGEPAQQAVGSPLEERAVALNHPEDAQRPHAQGERHQAVGDPDARVEHQRQVPVSQDARAEERTQTHVPGGAHHEGGGKGDERDAGGRAAPISSASPRKSATWAAITRRCPWTNSRSWVLSAAAALRMRWGSSVTALASCLISHRGTLSRSRSRPATPR